ncbi:bifunctional sugar-1-phosphate nucleotidylyltransferase/acetyltransferase [Halococcoides cellulosivorans]|uniref:Bifunctional protein GlmU n=1 Tax=Halococcoides cellulosivorans TaxID=1679096 RepID=A0A2R4X163_9EURY|nr:bifunctional sugar-1-phosphate nucleotidylyltransferase/acetyltransferase [Halococcoides cellulosivorans]AWB27525.1 glucose-1-phosphate thymidylyltransferase [Halococcoides cellulosivorans]
MQTVVLAAGEGTRMGPLTDATPKPMLPVGDRPLVAHVADAAVAAGATELIVVVGYEAEAIRSYFGSAYRGVPVTFAHQPERLGTADAVRTARDRLDGPFAVLNGDNWYDPDDLAALFDGGPAVGVTRVEDPREYGVITVTDGVATRIREKPSAPESYTVNAGAYVFPGAALDCLDVPQSQRGEYELTDVLERVIDSHDVQAVEFDRWLDVGRPWDLLAATERALDDLDRRIEGSVHEDATLRGPVVVESGATVDARTVIEGPVIVRSGAEVGPNAYIRGKTVIGPDASLGGQSVEIKNSIVRAGTSVAHLSYVGDSVIGRNCNFGAGTTVANLRHDETSVEVAIDGERVSTDRRKFGVVTGDDVKTGIDTSIDAGSVLESGARTDPGAVVRTDR